MEGFNQRFILTVFVRFPVRDLVSHPTSSRPSKIRQILRPRFHVVSTSTVRVGRAFVSLTIRTPPFAIPLTLSSTIESLLVRHSDHNSSHYLGMPLSPTYLALQQLSVVCRRRVRTRPAVLAFRRGKRSVFSAKVDTLPGW